MSEDTDTNASEPEAHPLEGYSPVFEKDETEPLTANEARRLLAERRGPTPEPESFDLIDKATGKPLDPKRTLNSSTDLPKVAKMMGDYREEQAKALAELRGEQPRAANGQFTKPEAPAEGTEAPAEGAAEDQPDDPLAEDRQRISAREAELNEQRRQLEEMHEFTIMELSRTVAPKFAFIKTPDDLARLAQVNPALHAEFVQVAELATKSHAEMARLKAERQTSMAPKEEEKFLKLHPEYKDQKKADAFFGHMFDYLATKGISKAEAAREPAFKTAMGLSILLDAVNWRQAQESRKNIRNNLAPAPPVQRPGTYRPTVSPASAELQRLRGADNLSPRQGARLLQLERQRGG